MSDIILQSKCSCCGIEGWEKNPIHEHHIIPQLMGFEDNETIPLCRYHHQVIHHMLNKVIFDNRKLEKEELIKKIKEWTKWYCTQEWELWKRDDKSFFSNHCRLCRSETKFVWYDYDYGIGGIGICEKCFDVKNKILKCKKCNTRFANEISNFPGTLHSKFDAEKEICPRCLRWQ